MHKFVIAVLALIAGSVSNPVDEIDLERAYFSEVVLGTEVGSGPRAVRKWTSNPAIETRGDPTDADLRTMCEVIAELNELVAPLELRMVSETPNVIVHFVPEAEFGAVLPDYRPPNRGFHWVNWNEFGEIYKSIILISTDVSQDARSHIIREEMTQSLGLLMDSSSYPDSIFYSGWSTTSEYSDLDRAVIRLLYDPQVEPGSVPEFVR